MLKRLNSYAFMKIYDAFIDGLTVADYNEYFTSRNEVYLNNTGTVQFWNSWWG